MKDMTLGCPMSQLISWMVCNLLAVMGKVCQHSGHHALNETCRVRIATQSKSRATMGIEAI